MLLASRSSLGVRTSSGAAAPIASGAVMKPTRRRRCPASSAAARMMLPLPSLPAAIVTRGALSDPPAKAMSSPADNRVVGRGYCAGNARRSARFDIQRCTAGEFAADFDVPCGDQCGVACAGDSGGEVSTHIDPLWRRRLSIAPSSLHVAAGSELEIAADVDRRAGCGEQILSGDELGAAASGQCISSRMFRPAVMEVLLLSRLGGPGEQRLGFASRVHAAGAQRSGLPSSGSGCR